jgi:hypothetical protein
MESMSSDAERTTGRCLCGAVRYEIEGRISPIFLCHCGKCRRATGSAFHATSVCQTSQFRWLAGEEEIRQYEESPTYVVSFCGRCGSPVPTYNEGLGQIALHAGALDGDPGRRVRHHIFVDSKAPWFDISDDLPRYAGHRPRPKDQR